MSRLIGPKARICRALGVNIFGSPKYDKILAKKPHGPGAHGQGRKGKLSQYGIQLKAKQLARFMFGISEKQFSNYAAKASAQPGDTAENLLKLLECRADNVVYKAGFAKTIHQARQMVNHGHFELNGKKIQTPSIQIKIGDTLTVREIRVKSPLYQEVKKSAKNEKKVTVPAWLKSEKVNLSIEMLENPTFKDFDPLIQSQYIVEFYSR